MQHQPGLRAAVVVSAFLILSSGVLALQGPASRGPVSLVVPATEPSVLPEASPAKAAQPKAISSTGGFKPKPVAPTAERGKTCLATGADRSGDVPLTSGNSMRPYEGVGAWVDIYDYCIAGDLDPAATIAELSRRGVKTLYLQTGRWTESSDIAHVAKVAGFLDRAAEKDIAVVGWYVPGFGDIDRDVRRSLAVLSFKTPSGNGFAGFGADIETRREVGGNRDLFNRGIVEYSKRLREAAGDRVLSAIVVDAKNNERAPSNWLGFPWTAIGEHYDVVMPMAYWSVRRGYNAPACWGPQLDTASYMTDVMTKTKALMRKDRPIHLIGGIADCVTRQEMAAYIDAAKRLGSIGVSLYDYNTTRAHPAPDALWQHLARFES